MPTPGEQKIISTGGISPVEKITPSKRGGQFYLKSMTIFTVQRPTNMNVQILSKIICFQKRSCVEEKDRQSAQNHIQYI